MRRSPASLALRVVVLGLALGAGAGRAPAQDELRWRVAPDDFVHYRVVEEEVEDSDAPAGTVRRAAASDLHGFYGYELEEGRQVRRALTREEWLAVPYVFRLPGPRIDPSAQLAIDETIPGTWRLGAVRARGHLAVREVRETEQGPQVLLSGLVLFAPEEEAGGTALSYRVLGTGRLSWTSTFDVAEGLVTRVEYDLRWTSGSTGRPPPRAVHQLRPGDRAWRARLTLEVDAVHRHRGPTFEGAVDGALERALSWLESFQREDGQVPGSGPFGTTALALLALIRGGRPASSPAVQKGFAWLLEREPRGTYETAMAAMAVEALGTPPEELARARRGELEAPLPRRLAPREQAFLKRCADYLLENAMVEEAQDRPSTGRERLLRWGYPFDYELNLEPDHPDWWDNSNTQYAVLGLNAAARCGVEVPPSVWAGVARHYLAVQAVEGEARDALRLTPHPRGGEPGGRRYAPRPVAAVERGWAYRECPRGGRPYGSMTCAGISSLAIAAANLEREGSRRGRRALRQEVDQAIRDGWAALDGMWTAFENPRYEGWFLYHLYGLERAGILSDVERFEGHDWYWEGAIQLLLRQEEDGSWPRLSSPPHDTIWAILFLARATVPVVTPR